MPTYDVAADSNYTYSKHTAACRANAIGVSATQIVPNVDQCDSPESERKWIVTNAEELLQYADTCICEPATLATLVVTCRANVTVEELQRYMYGEWKVQKVTPTRAIATGPQGWEDQLVARLSSGMIGAYCIDWASA